MKKMVTIIALLIGFGAHAQTQKIETPTQKLSSMIRKIETEKNARVIEVNLDDDHGVLHYEFEILKDGKKEEMKVSALDGKVLEVESDFGLFKDYDFYNNYKVVLSDVVDMITKTYPNAEIDEIDASKKQVVYTIELNEAGVEKKVYVDGVTGKILMQSTGK